MQKRLDNTKSVYWYRDLGTSSIKAILIDENQRVVGSVNKPLELINSKIGYYEQSPDSWYSVTLECLEELKNKFFEEIHSNYCNWNLWPNARGDIN